MEEIEKMVQCVCIGRFPLERGTVTIDLEQIALAHPGKCPDLVKVGNGGYAIFYHIPQTSDGQKTITPNGRTERIPGEITRATYSGYKMRGGQPFYDHIGWRFE